MSCEILKNKLTAKISKLILSMTPLFEFLIKESKYNFVYLVDSINCFNDHLEINQISSDLNCITTDIQQYSKLNPRHIRGNQTQHQYDEALEMFCNTIRIVL